ncbi:hypothetical protein ABN228_21995, partial [Providencia rettgeri]
MSASGRALYLLPFIAPMALLAVQALGWFSEKVLNAFARFAAFFWSGVILFLWACYAIVLTGHHAQWLPVFGRWLPLDYQMHFSVFALIAGIFITCFWFFRNHLISSSSSAFQAIRNWSLGMVSVWSIILTLFVGWIDYSKGYEGVFLDLRHHLEGQFTQNDCMASENLGESEAPMLYYYSGILHQRQMEFEKP